MKTLKTAPQILEHYFPDLDRFYLDEQEGILKAMRHYARVKSEKAYEEAYQSFVEQYWENTCNKNK